MKYKVTFVVEIEAPDENKAYTIAVTAVEGFPPMGVEVIHSVEESEEP